MAALTNRVSMAHALLQDAEKHGVRDRSVVVSRTLMTASPDDAARQECADLYARAKRSDRLYDDARTRMTATTKKKKAMKTETTRRRESAADGNFAQIMGDRLHEMEFKKIPALANGVAMLFAALRRTAPSTADRDAASDCPTLVQLLHSFPTGCHARRTCCHSQSSHALRAGDLEDALTVAAHDGLVHGPRAATRDVLAGAVRAAGARRCRGLRASCSSLVEVESSLTAQAP
ncbi:hypothetical protein PINS_up023712 [Pythium insidiosum]|nr:hypothetical protein PINS_up023712 [Pythium insidiosum]